MALASSRIDFLVIAGLWCDHAIGRKGEMRNILQITTQSCRNLPTRLPACAGMTDTHKPQQSLDRHT
jgi:hypothetical protein